VPTGRRASAARERGGSVERWLSGVTIDFTPVTYLDDFDSSSGVINGVNNAELALANAVAPFRAGKLFATNRSRFSSERGDSANDALAILLVTERFDFLSSRRLDEQPISGHVALRHGQRIRKKRFAQPCARQTPRDLQHLRLVRPLPPR